ncbi:MAG: hypothetical protein RJA99_1823 [Pseudomonadota bacterium]|jgi:parallel beta-helix repeat protein
MEALEPRLLHSGDGVGAAVGEAGAAFAASQPWVATAIVPSTQAAATQGTAAAGELVVVDARVPDVQRLIAGFEAQRDAGRALHVVRVQAGEDGVRAIDAALGEAGAGWSAVHLVGHGEPGELTLGTARIDAALLRARAVEIAQWSTRLGDGADLLLWGCDSGAGEAGAALLDGLSALTGADVAASDDATGGLAWGGDWALEVSRGRIGTDAPIDAALQAAYDGVLAIPGGGASGTVDAAKPVVVAETLTGVNGTNVSVPARQVAVGAAGTVTVWIEDDGTGTRIAGRFDAAAGGTGTRFVIASGAGVNRDTPSVAVDADGNAFFAWRDGRTVRVAYYAPPATAGGAMVLLDADRADIYVDDTIRGAVSASMSANGRVAAVAWAIQELPEVVGVSTPVRDIQVRRYALTPPGQPSPGMSTLDGAPIRITDYQGIPDYHPDVAIRNDGSGVVVLHTLPDPLQMVAQEPMRGVFAVPFDTNGTVPGNGSLLGTRLADGRTGPVGPIGVVFPSVALGAGNTGLAVWIESEGLTSTVQAVAIDASGNPIGDVVALGVGVQPSVAAVAGGRFAVSWTAPWQVGDGADISLVEVRVDAGGATVDGAPIRVNPTGNKDQIASSVAAGGGRIVVAWTDLGGNGPNDDTLQYRSFALPPPAVTIQAVNGTQATEGGAALAFDVRLADAPAGDTTVLLRLAAPGQAYAAAAQAGFVTAPGEGLASERVLQFTAANWDSPQRVMLAAIDDRVVDGNLAVRLGATPSGGTTAAVDLTIIDDDTRNVFVVTTTADVDDTGADALTPLALHEHRMAGNAVSLREALQAANADGGSATARDRIVFALPGGVGRIVVTRDPLPTIASAIDLDGGPFSDDAPSVEIVRGNGVGGGADGLVLGAGSDGSRIAGLAVGGFSDAISIRSASNLIENNWLGIGRAGVVDAGSDFANRARGVETTDLGDTQVSLAGNVIRGNRIANNGEGGMRILGSRADGTEITGNTIEGNGLAKNASDGGYGIKLTNNADGATVGGDPLTAPERANLIRGNGAYGILVNADSAYNRIVGNELTGQGTPLRVDTPAPGAPAAPMLSGARLFTGDDGSVRAAVAVSVAAPPGQEVRIDVYAGATAGSVAWVARALLTADADGQATGVVALPSSVGEGSVLVATVTRALPLPNTGSATRDTTSGLSAGVPVKQVSGGGSAPPSAARISSAAGPPMQVASLAIQTMFAADAAVATATSASNPAAASALPAASASASVAGSAAVAPAGEAAARAAATATATAPSGASTASSVSSPAASSAATPVQRAAVSVPGRSAAAGPAEAVIGIGAPQSGSIGIAVASTGAAVGGGAALAAIEHGAERGDVARGGGAGPADGSGPTRGAASSSLGDALRRSGASASGVERLSDVQREAWSPAIALQETAYSEVMRQAREEAGAQFETRTVIVTSTMMLGTSISIGYAVWMARGGVLLTSLLASMPAWRSIDPLPVLARTDARGRDDEGEDDSLRGLLARAAERAAGPGRGADAEPAPEAPSVDLRPGLSAV